MEFDFDVDIIYSHVAQVLVGVGLLAAIYLIFIYRSKIMSVVKHHDLRRDWLRGAWNARYRRCR